jgi:hypothetical protein
MRIMLQNITLKFPSCLIFRVILPLDLLKFHHIVSSHSFFFIQNFDGILHVRKIRLEREPFNLHCLIRNSQTLLQLRHMENIMKGWQYIWELDAISNSTTLLQKNAGSNIARS